MSESASALPLARRQFILTVEVPLAEPKAEVQIIGGLVVVILLMIAWLLGAGRKEEES